MEDKKDLDQPVTARDFQEFTDGLSDVIGAVVDERVKRHTDDVLTAVDGVLHEVTAMRQEQSAHTHRHDQTAETLRDHEHRIKRVENHAGAMGS